MASQMSFFIDPFQSAAPVNNRQIDITGPVNATVFTNSSGAATYTYSLFGPQLPAGTYTITVATDPGEELAGPDTQFYQGNPITWVCAGPSQPNPSFTYKFLYTRVLRFRVWADCPGANTIWAEGATITLDGVSQTVPANGEVDFTTFGGTITVDAEFTGSNFNLGVYGVGGVLPFSSVPASRNIGRFFGAGTTPILANINFTPPGGCGTATPGGSGGAIAGSLCHCRTHTGRLLIAHTITVGSVLSRRYDDGLPPALMESVNVDSGTTALSSLARRPCGGIDVVYGLDGAIKLKTTRNRGRTYGTAMTIAASGYRNPTHTWDEHKNRMVVAMQSTSNSAWYVTIAGLDSSGNLATAWSTPVQMVTGTGNNAAHLEWNAEGGFTFTYLNSANAITIVRCRKLSNTGAGTWS